MGFPVLDCASTSVCVRARVGGSVCVGLIARGGHRFLRRRRRRRRRRIDVARNQFTADESLHCLYIVEQKKTHTPTKLGKKKIRSFFFYVVVVFREKRTDCKDD